MQKRAIWRRLLIGSTFALAMVGCAAEESSETPSSDAGSSETQAQEPSEPVIDPDVDVEALNGTLPAEPKPIIEFSALNYDGSPRNQDDLVGQPTVLWFFPFAGTPG